MTVFVIDGWNETKSESIVEVYRDRRTAKRKVDRILQRAGKDTIYIGVVERTVRRVVALPTTRFTL